MYLLSRVEKIWKPSLPTGSSKLFFMFYVILDCLWVSGGTCKKSKIGNFKSKDTLRRYTMFRKVSWKTVGIVGLVLVIGAIAALTIWRIPHMSRAKAAGMNYPVLAGVSMP